MLTYLFSKGYAGLGEPLGSSLQDIFLEVFVRGHKSLARRLAEFLQKWDLGEEVDPFTNPEGRLSYWALFLTLVNIFPICLSPRLTVDS